MTEYVPCWVILDGSNRPFDSWILPEEVERINSCGGIGNIDFYQLRETTDKPIPEAFKNGIVMTKDIWCVTCPGPAFNYGKS